MRIAVAGSFIAAMLLTSATAAADVDFQTTQFAPAGSHGVLSGGVRPLASQLNGQYICLDPATIANTFNSWAIGNCTGIAWNGNQIFYATTTVYTGGVNWDGGYFSANFNGCGWLEDFSIYPLNNSVNNNCQGSGAFHTPSSFIAPGSCGSNNARLAIWSNTGCSTDGSDGLAAYNNDACPAFANISPWSSTAVPSDYEYSIPVNPPNQSHTNPVYVNIRYKARYSEDGMVWDMVRVLNPPEGGYESNWVFMPDGCGFTLK